jgi:hypothetical protein
MAGVRIDELKAEARYRSERLALYRARAYGPRPTSPVRLRELERAAVAAEARWREALTRQPRATPDG